MILEKKLLMTKNCSNFQKSGIFENLKVLPLKNRHFLLHSVIFDDFKTSKWLKIEFRLKPVNIAMLASYGAQNSSKSAKTISKFLYLIIFVF